MEWSYNKHSGGFTESSPKITHKKWTYAETITAKELQKIKKEQADQKRLDKLARQSRAINEEVMKRELLDLGLF